MRTFFLTGIGIIGILLFLCAGTADQVPDAGNASEQIWNGTWESDGYTLFIKQNDTAIAGTYEPLNISLADPGVLTGSLSADGKVFSGTWTESGSLNMVLADDKMSYVGAGTVRPDESVNESGAYTVLGTRMESSFDPEKVWNGTWVTEHVVNALTQDGTTVTGIHHPLPGIEDEPGLFEGTVSEDGKTLNGTWMETGNFTFTLADDGMSWNGTYDLAQNASAGSSSWNARKVA
jgi:hypothetical protein